MDVDVTCCNCGTTAVVDVDETVHDGFGSHVAESGWRMFFACQGCCDEATWTCPNC